jgi:hypothetical protein
MVVQRQVIWTRAKLIFAILVRSCGSSCLSDAYTRTGDPVKPRVHPFVPATDARSTGPATTAYFRTLVLPYSARSAAYSSQGSSGFPKWP